MSNHPPPDKFLLLSPDERHRLGQIYSLILSWRNDASEEFCQQAPRAKAEDKTDLEVLKPGQGE